MSAFGNRKLNMFSALQKREIIWLCLESSGSRGLTTLIACLIVCLIDQEVGYYFH